MYSDMSMRTMARSSSNRNSARARASSVLPTPVGPRKINEPIGRFGIAQPGARAADGVGHALERLVLTDDAQPQAVFHVDQLLDLAFEHLGNRNAGPLGDDAGNVFFVDFFFEHAPGLAVDLRGDFVNSSSVWRMSP